MLRGEDIGFLHRRAELAGRNGYVQAQPLGLKGSLHARKHPQGHQTVCLVYRNNGFVDTETRPSRMKDLHQISSQSTIELKSQLEVPRHLPRDLLTPQHTVSLGFLTEHHGLTDCLRPLLAFPTRCSLTLLSSVFESFDRGSVLTGAGSKALGLGGCINIREARICGYSRGRTSTNLKVHYLEIYIYVEAARAQVQSTRGAGTRPDELLNALLGLRAPSARQRPQCARPRVTTSTSCAH